MAYVIIPKHGVHCFVCSCHGLEYFVCEFMCLHLTLGRLILGVTAHVSSEIMI